MRGLNPTIAYVVAGVLALLLVLYVFSGGSRENPERLTDQEVAGTSAPAPEERCGSQQTYDLIKRELFRRAAEVRAGEQAAFDEVAAYSVVRVESPMLRSHDEDAGTVSCSGAVTLDLPPGVAVADGRRTLTGEIGYALPATADGRGQVLTLSNADSLVAALATLARTGTTAGAPPPGEPADEPAAPATEAQASRDRAREAAPAPRETTPPSPPRPRAAPTPSRPTATASPSFNCRYARARSEIAVCNDSGLAALDRQMASQFNRSMSQANAAQRALLQRTRSRFLSYREGCRSNACIAEAYRGRMREISDIMAGRWRAP